MDRANVYIVRARTLEKGPVMLSWTQRSDLPELVEQAVLAALDGLADLAERQPVCDFR
jgi:hypothetical protein